MINIYNTNIETNQLEEINKIQKGCWVNLVSPSDEEIINVCSELKISTDYVKDSLDYEEKARIDTEEDDGTVLFVIDVPVIEKEGDSYTYSTMPLGVIIVRDDYIVTVSLRKSIVIEKFIKSKVKNFVTYMKSRFLFQIMLENSSAYLTYLKRINKETEIAESTLKHSMKNRELLKMLSLEKSLVYFTTSIKSNEVVMEKTLRGKFIKLYEDDEDILEDAIIENKQAIEMGKIYSDILNGTMDAYASIISNNLNGVMKFLTSITIILAIPTMIASYWGMNVQVPMQYVESKWPFFIVVAASIILGIIAMIWLKKRDMLD